jgi:hypothetical protein
MYNSYNDFGLESLKVLAVALVIVSMVLRLNLGFSHGCGLGFRSLDLLVLVKHNYNIVTLV